MKATLFPFTDISEPQLSAATAVFGNLLIYQPSSLPSPPPLQAMIDSGAVELRRPVQGDEKRLHALLQEYRQWAELHGNDDLARFKPRQGEIPFFEDDSPLKIRSEVLRQTRSGPTAPSAADALFQARVFLEIAHAFDRQQQELQQELETIDAHQQAMLRELGGFDDLPVEKATGVAPLPDPGDNMTTERLSAWSRLALQAPQADAVLVTGSRAVWDLLADRFPATQILAQWPLAAGLSADSEAAVQWRTKLWGILDDLAQTDWPPSAPPALPALPPVPAAAPGPLALTLALMPTTSLPRLLADLAGIPPVSTEKDFACRHRHTLLALIA